MTAGKGTAAAISKKLRMARRRRIAADPKNALSELWQVRPEGK